MKIKDIKATGVYVVLKAVPAEETKEVVTEGGIVLSGDASGVNEATEKINDPKGGKLRIQQPKVYSIGSKVKKEEYGFDIGDTVVYNNYDSQVIQPEPEEEIYYILCKADSIKAVIKEEK